MALYSAVERCIDTVASLAMLLVLSVPFLIIALAIKSDSKGPVFYCQSRAGKNGKPFRMIKLRTMVPGAEIWAAALKWLSMIPGLPG